MKAREKLNRVAFFLFFPVFTMYDLVKTIREFPRMFSTISIIIVSIFIFGLFVFILHMVGDIFFTALVFYIAWAIITFLSLKLLVWLFLLPPKRG